MLMDFYDAQNAFAQLGYSATQQMITNGINQVYSNIANKKNFEYAKKINAMNLKNMELAPVAHAKGLASLGLRPTSDKASYGNQVTASFAPTQISSSPTADFFGMSNAANQSQLSRREAMRQKDFDDEITALMQSFSHVGVFRGSLQSTSSKGALDALIQGIQYLDVQSQLDVDTIRRLSEKILFSNQLNSKEYQDAVIQSAIQQYKNLTKDGQIRDLDIILKTLQYQMTKNGNILNYIDSISEGNASASDFAKLLTLITLGQDGGLFKLAPFSFKGK